MARVQCVTCGGVYDTVLPDGYEYYHVCPPLSAPELAQAVADGKVVLPKDETPDDAVARRVYLRKSARNENVRAADDPSKPATPIALGQGTQPAPAPDPAVAVGPVTVDV